MRTDRHFDLDHCSDSLNIRECALYDTDRERERETRHLLLGVAVVRDQDSNLCTQHSHPDSFKTPIVESIEGQCCLTLDLDACS